MGFSKLRALLALVTLIYIVSPIVFKYSTFIQRSFLFMNHVNTQYYFNLSFPEQLGIKCARTLRLHNNLDTSRERVELGTWHILPESRLPHCTTSNEDNRTFIEDQSAFNDDRPIVLYIHGNGGTRAGSHRGQLYRRLAYEQDCHIITFDYRGYGDSTYLQPTTSGLSLDAKFMYQWLVNQPNVTRERVVLWGHSLGTAVAVRMVADLPPELRPGKLILEAPFDSVANAIANHPFSAPFRLIPYFEHFFVDPIENAPELNFDSASRIGDITSTQIMILHAEDDGIIPYKLGYNLYKRAVDVLSDAKVKFISISGTFGLGHKHICNHEETMTKVKKFIVDEL